MGIAVGGKATPDKVINAYFQVVLNTIKPYTTGKGVGNEGDRACFGDSEWVPEEVPFIERQARTSHLKSWRRVSLER